MKERLIVAVIFIPFLFVIVLFFPPYALAAVIAIICAICAYELLRAAGINDNKRIAVYAIISAAIIPAGAYFGIGEFVFTAITLVLLCLVFIEAILAIQDDRRIVFAQIMMTLFGGSMIPFMLSSLISLKNMEEGGIFVLLPVISAFITDAGSYFVGIVFGKHKAFPLISPKKTVEGYIGGLVIGTVAMVVYGIVLVFTTQFKVGFFALVLYGIIGAALTELGDLIFSFIKREFDVKDYGHLLPGHGGALDRFDSMVLTAPAMYLLVSAMPAIMVK